MRIVIPGGSGHVGSILRRHLVERGHDVLVLSRAASSDPGVLCWDGRSLGDWARAIDGADAVINLAGRSVNRRYTAPNLREMMDSRVDSTRAVGQGIARLREAGFHSEFPAGPDAARDLVRAWRARRGARAGA